MPDVPTMAEAGVSDFEATFWLAMFAPAGTPKSIVEKINGELATVLQSVSVKAAFEAQGVEPKRSSPDELGAMLRRDIDTFRDVSVKYGIKLE